MAKNRERAAFAAERRARRAYNAARAEARHGLVDVPYSHGRYWGEVAPAGTYLAVRSTGVKQCVTPHPSTRGNVTSFSRRSRSRMLKTTAKISQTQLSTSLFVTLTYPAQFSTESCIQRAHFKSWLMRLQRKFSRVSAIWKLEFQQRGAPHWHLLLLNVPFLARQWLSQSWYEVVGSDDPRHLRAGTNVQRSESRRKAVSYVAKYIAKLPEREGPPWQGRFWGVIGRKYVDTNTLQWELDVRGFARLARAIRHVVHSRSAVSNLRTRRNVGWCFFDGARGVALLQWAAGLTWQSFSTSS